MKVVCEWWRTGHLSTVVRCRRKAVARSVTGTLCRKHARATLRALERGREAEKARADLPTLDEWYWLGEWVDRSGGGLRMRVRSAWLEGVPTPEVGAPIKREPGSDEIIGRVVEVDPRGCWIEIELDSFVAGKMVSVRGYSCG